MFEIDKQNRLSDMLEVLANVENPNKFNFPNIGNRSLTETVDYLSENANSVKTALEDFKQVLKLYKNEPILVDGLAVDYWTRGRKTEDIDIFFLTKSRLPRKIWYGSTNFKPFSSTSDIHPSRLYHKSTGTEIDLVTPTELNLPSRYSAFIYRNFVQDHGIKIASIESLILMKLIAFRPKDQVDISMLLENPYLDLSKIYPILTVEHKEKLEMIKPHDANKYEESRAKQVERKAKKLVEDLNPIFEMANLTTKRTGLSDEDLVIYISTKQGSTPRVRLHNKSKLGLNSPYISFSVENVPKILEIKGNFSISIKIEKEVKDWIVKNKNVLLQLWKDDPDGLIILDYMDRLIK